MLIHYQNTSSYITKTQTVMMGRLFPEGMMFICMSFFYPFQRRNPTHHHGSRQTVRALEDLLQTPKGEDSQETREAGAKSCWSTIRTKSQTESRQEKSGRAQT